LRDALPISPGGRAGPPPGRQGDGSGRRKRARPIRAGQPLGGDGTMRRQGILHPQISRIISEMGHTDGLVVADAGLPIPKGVERVDLAFLPGVPSFLTVLDGILAELSIEGALLAQEIQEANPTLWREVQSRLQVPIEYVPHQRFKERLPSVRAVIRTGECTPYANVILFSSTQGIFPG